MDACVAAVATVALLCRCCAVVVKREMAQVAHVGQLKIKRRLVSKVERIIALCGAAMLISTVTFAAGMLSDTLLFTFTRDLTKSERKSSKKNSTKLPLFS